MKDKLFKHRRQSALKAVKNVLLVILASEKSITTMYRFHYFVGFKVQVAPVTDVVVSTLV